MNISLSLMDLEEKIPKHLKRKHIYNYFYNLLQKYIENQLNCMRKSINIEIALFNYSITKYRNTDNEIVNFWNVLFENIYIGRAKTIYNNLNPESCIKNIKLIHKFINNDFSEHELVNFTPEQLFYDKYHSLRKLYNLDKHVKTINLEDIPDGIYKCKKCYSYKTSYYTQQVRSADESESIFIKCLLCGLQWRIG